jgi:Outer membrane protein beta-barrel domain
MKRLIALALVVPAAALAQESNGISYGYFDVGYLGSNWDFGTTDSDANGITGRFSIDIRDEFFVFGGYQAWDFDDIAAGGSVSKTIGLGKAFAIGNRWSVYGRGGITALDLDTGLGNVEDEGVLLEGGARIRFGEMYEVRGALEYADVGDTGVGEGTFRIGADLHLTDVVALSIELSENEESISAFTVGLRFYPGRDSSALRKRR